MISTDSVDIYSSAIGYSDRGNKRLLKIDNKFIIGSLSKPFTAVLILREFEKGHLSLEDSINTIGYEENENKTLVFEINSLDLHNYVATGGFISNVVDLKNGINCFTRDHWLR
ncbi:serine hydrolase domain-containing protein [Cellulophaga lytica]|nr:serine hydrolase domain-containing protein [Cellulophaga lytica]